MARPRLSPLGARTLATRDSFENAIAQIGMSSGNGPGNLLSAGTYGYNPITRNRVLLEYAYRGSWIVRRMVDNPAEDMTRAGIEYHTSAPPDVLEQINQFWEEWGIWSAFHEAIGWGRLYGGSILVPVIDGQDLESPLWPLTVRQDQFKGLLVLDRWMVQPSLEDLVTDPGPDMGKPRFYKIFADDPSIPAGHIHYSRAIRFGGDPLPYWQRQSENLWDASVLEAPYDRFIAYDSTTMGVAQLVFKSHLRTLKIENLRTLIAAGGRPGGGGMFDALMQQVNFIRFMQSFEGLTLLDQKDTLETQDYTFSGLNDVLMQFGQQLAGAMKQPLVRLFGQSPAGLNSTGDADFRNYYDGINADQNSKMRRGVSLISDLIFRSVTGCAAPAGTTFVFKPLWQLQDSEKADIAAKDVDTVTKAHDSGLISPRIALQELRASSRITGRFTNISDADVAAADEQPPQPPDPMDMLTQMREGANSGEEGHEGDEDGDGSGQTPSGIQRLKQPASGPDGPLDKMGSAT